MRKSRPFGYTIISKHMGVMTTHPTQDSKSKPENRIICKRFIEFRRVSLIENCTFCDIFKKNEMGKLTKCHFVISC